MNTLDETTPEDRIKATISHRRKCWGDTDQFSYGLDHALTLMQPDGWKHVCAAWFDILPSKQVLGVKSPKTKKPCTV